MTEQPYIHSLDPFPQETLEHNQLYRFYELLREGRLTTRQCNKCGAAPWPPRTVCPNCMCNELEWVDLPKRGKLYACTVQYAGVPYMFEVPLMMGMVEFENGLRILSRIVDATPEQLDIGTEVELTVLDIPGNRVIHAFKPVG